MAQLKPIATFFEKLAHFLPQSDEFAIAILKAPTVFKMAYERHPYLLYTLVSFVCIGVFQVIVKKMMNKRNDEATQEDINEL